MDRKTGIVAIPALHPPLDEGLWRVVMAYARRWQVEMCYQACNTNLAMERPRLWFWENRLMMMVSPAYVCRSLC